MTSVAKVKRIPGSPVLCLAPFNDFKCMEKDIADALLLQSSTLALGLVEEGIWVWAPELASHKV